MRWVGGVVYRNFIRSACASFSTYYCLKCTISRPSMIFTVPLWGSEVANSKTEYVWHYYNTFLAQQQQQQEHEGRPDEQRQQQQRGNSLGRRGAFIDTSCRFCHLTFYQAVGKMFSHFLC